MLVAAITTLPLAHLYQLGRNTIWAPAVLHAGIDSFKLVTIPGEARQVFSLTLAALSLTIPLLALLDRGGRRTRESAPTRRDHAREAPYRASPTNPAVHDTNPSSRRTT
jgi:hypothetical protein